MSTRHAASTLASLFLGVVMQPVFAQSTVEPQHPGNPGYDALLADAVAPVDAAFGGRVQVNVERLDRLGRWAFLQGTLRGADGGAPDYSGTSYAERAVTGGMSNVYVALLQADAEPDGGVDTGAQVAWSLVDHAIGPSDVAWLTWPTKYAAPRQLFGF